MKKLILMFFCIVLSFILLIGCSDLIKSSKKSKTKVPNKVSDENNESSTDIVFKKPYKPVPELQKIKTPIWYYDDIEAINIIKEHDENIKLSTSKRTVYKESIYYKGPMPFEVSVLYKIPQIDVKLPDLPDLKQPIYYDFGDFISFFIYGTEPMQPKLGICGAGTNENEKVVAEARFVRSLENGFEIEEFHYNSKAELIFKCKSQFDEYGLKISETEKIGKKIKDYYFLWPIVLE